MDTARHDSPMPLLHPRLARLEPALRPRVRTSRARLAASTLGACIVLTFAAHAFPGPQATTSTTTVTAPRQTGEGRASVVPTRYLPAT
jgi:hypothetical protein